MFGPSPTPSRLCKTPVEVPSGTRPRATACTAPVGCLTSATTGSTGRRRFRKGVSQLATCSSTTTYSTSTTAIIVRSVFSCVASRKRAPTGCLIGLADEKSFDRENSSFRVPSGQRSQLFSWQTSGLLSRAQRETVGPLPSREESISFLSPARAAGAPTFCDATESRQRTQPRGLSPPWPSPAATRTWPSPLADRRQRCFAKQAPIFGCRAAPSPARGGGGWPERLFESQLFNLTPGCKPSTEKVRPVAHPPTDRTAARKPRSAIARPSAAPRGGRNFVAAPPATGPSLKTISPHGHCPRALAIQLFRTGRNS